MSAIAPNMTETEWQSRVDCAAGHRLLDLYGLTDLVEGLVSVRITGEPDAFLIKGYGDFFDEVRASGLHKIRFDDRPDVGAGRPLNYASCNQVKYILQARPDINAVIHTHTDATAVVASLEDGFQPMTQHGFIAAPHVAYVDFDVEIDDACMEKTVAALGERKILLMRNHGMMVIGESLAEAFFLARALDIACRCQLDAMHAGARIRMPDDDPARTKQMIHDYTFHPEHLHIFNGSMQWDGLKRKLDRERPGYET